MYELELLVRLGRGRGAGVRRGGYFRVGCWLRWEWWWKWRRMRLQYNCRREREREGVCVCL